MTRLWRTIPALLAVAGLVGVWLWLTSPPALDLRMRVDVAGEGAPKPVDVKFPGEFKAGDGKPVDLPGSWPHFRGTNYDAVSPESTPLAREWPKEGPKVLWTVAMGLGYAGPAVARGRVYVLDYDEAKRADTLRCLSLADGQEIWRRGYGIPIESVHGFSRSIPAVDEKHVVTLGPLCHAMCVDAETGDFRWGIDLVKEYGAVVPKWYSGQCPLIEGGRAIFAPGGKDVLMMAVECEGDGKVAWKTPNPAGWRMTHSSIIPMDFAGRRMLVYSATGGVVGVAADDGKAWKAGDVLWQRSDWQVPFANVPSPVVIGGGHVLLAGGYGGGSMMIRLAEDGDRLKSEVVWRFESSKEFAAEQQTPIFFGGNVYGVLPKEARSLGEQLVCVDLEGKHLWTSGRADRFGLGPFIIADRLLFIMNDSGLLTLAEAAPDGYKPLARAQVMKGREAWGPMAIAGGRLIVRDIRQMLCLDVAAPK